MKTKITQNLKSIILTLVLVLGVSYVSASTWVNPPGNPPACPSTIEGCNTPLNVGSTQQDKTGPLRINTGVPAPATGLSVWGNSIFYGNVGIGVPAAQMQPGFALQVKGGIYGVSSNGQSAWKMYTDSRVNALKFSDANTNETLLALTPQKVMAVDFCTYSTKDTDGTLTDPRCLSQIQKKTSHTGTVEWVYGIKDASHARNSGEISMSCGPTTGAGTCSVVRDRGVAVNCSDGNYMQTYLKSTTFDGGSWFFWNYINYCVPPPFTSSQ